MNYIELSHATKTFKRADGATFAAFEDVSFGIERGAFVCVLGPSGCGKSALLNAIAGFSLVTSGSVKIGGEEVKEPSPKRVMIFQNYGLLPWRTVLKNVELGLEERKIPKEERRAIAEKYVEIVGLSAFKDERPRRLSGGMQQRVSIARALAVDPEVVFMDEPFAALDAITRMKLQDDVLKLSREEKKTVVFVTHDVGEAVYLADRILILSPNPGRLKSVVNVTIGREFRNRAGADFFQLQKQVFELFEGKGTGDPVEYYI